MQAVILVALGSTAGGMARFWLSGVVGRRIGERFPWGTLAVNASGALAIGAIAAAAVAGGPLAMPESWQLAVTGFLGSYTTVSSFSLQTLALARAGEGGRAAANVLLSLALCLGAVALGFGLGRAVLG